jgi:hypothetical protein
LERSIPLEELKEMISGMIRLDADMRVCDIVTGILRRVSRLSDEKLIPFGENTSKDDQALERELITLMKSINDFIKGRDGNLWI